MVRPPDEPEVHQMTTTDRPTSGTQTADTEGIAQTARNVADNVGAAAGEVGARIPEVAQSTRDALTEANRLVQGGSDETLKLVGATAIGLATGLLLGGANRILVILAMLPAALIGATLVERMDRRPGSTSNRSSTAGG
jgi:hypothetical protein